MEQERSAKEIIAGNSLNEYELALFRGLKQSRGSEKVKSKILSEAITNVMNGNIELDGSEMTVAEALTIKVVGDALANPSTSKLKDFATIVGDVGPMKVEIEGRSLVDAGLAAMALGEEDGEER